MSKDIDQKVVEMRFDNQKFEQNVQKSLGTLDKLKGALDFGKSTKSLEGLERAFGSFDLKSFSDNIQTIADRFSNFGIVGDQIIRRLTDGFLGLANSVKNTVKELTLDQVGAGWTKYADKTASVQTIMNATGKSIDEVNGYLDKLMWFSDETSYGFTDMTKALGQLTSAGGDIEKLIPMITGIANATAYAGKGPAEFSRAIYNLNQSYSAGSLQYMDWKSIEQAGVNSEALKQTFIDTAVALGKINEGQVTIANFSSSLKDKWADTEVMEAAFGKFGQVTEEAYKLVASGEFDTASDAYASLAGQFDEVYYKAARAGQEAKSFAEVLESTKDAVSSGWMKTFELIFGNYEEAKVLWTDMSNSFWELFASGAEGRNDLLSGWHNALSADGTYYDTFVNSISNMLDGLVGVREILVDITSNILPKIDVDVLTGLTDKFKAASTKFKNFFDTEQLETWEEHIRSATSFVGGQLITSDGTIYNESTLNQIKAQVEKIHEFKDALSGVAHFINLIRKGFVTLSNSLSPLGKVFESSTNGAIKIGGALGRLLGRLDAAYEVTDGFRETMKGLADVISSFIDTGADKISSFIDGLGLFKKSSPDVDGLSKSMRYLNLTMEEFEDLGEKSNKVIEKTKDVFSKLNIDKIKQDFSDTFSGFTSALSIIGKIGASVFGAVPSLIGLLGKLFGWIFKITGSIGRFTKSVDDSVESTNVFSKIIDSISSGIDKLVKFVQPAIDVIKEFGKTLWESLSAGNFEGLKNLANAGLSAGMLSGIIKFIKSLKNASPDESGGIIDALKELKGAFVDTFSSIQDTLKSKQLLSIAEAVAILAASLFVLSKINPDELTGGLLGMTALFGELLGFLAALNAISGKKGTSGIVSLSKQLMKIAEAIAVFSVALKILSTIKMEDMQIALLGLGGVFGELIGFIALLKLISGDKGIKGISKIGKAMEQMSVALLVLSGVMKILGGMEIEQIKNGLLAMGGILGEVIVFVAAMAGIQKLIGNSKLISIAIGMTIMADALLVLSGVVFLLSRMSWESLAKGGAAIAGLLIIIGAFAAVMNSNIGGLLAGAAALLLITPALLIMAGVIALLGEIGLAKVGIGLLGIGGAIAILAVGLNVMAAALPGAAALIIAAGAIAILAPALALLGAMPLENIGKALLALVGGFAVLFAAAVFLGPVSPLLLGIAAALLLFGAAVALAGVGVSLLAAGLSALALSAAAGATALVAALGIIITGIGDIAVGAVDSIAKVISAIVQAVVKSIPEVLAGILTVIIAVLGLLIQYAPTIVGLVIDLIIAVIDAIGKRIPDLIQAGIDLMINFINGMADGIRDNADKVYAAVGNLLSSIIEFAITGLQRLAELIPFFGDDISNALENAKTDIRETLAPESMQQITEDSGDGLTKGLDNKKPEVEESAEDIKEAAVDPISTLPSEYSNYAGMSIDELVNSYSIGGEKVSAASNETHDKALSGVNGLPEEFEATGGYASSGMANGIANNSWKVEDAARLVAKRAAAVNRKELDINSPSKVGEEIGMYFDLGIAGGIKGYGDTVDMASKAVANTAIFSMQNSLSTLSDLVNSEMDSDPVIKPVLDLSQVRSGAEAIGALLGNQNGISIGDLFSGRAQKERPHGNVTTSNYGGFVINITQKDNESPEELAERMMYEIQAILDRKEASI